MTRVVTKRRQVFEFWDGVGTMLGMINTQAMDEFVVPFVKDVVLWEFGKEVLMHEMRFEGP